jgi:tryptophan synthase beta chain
VASNGKRHAYLLDEDQMPTTWYNVIPDLPSPPPPPLHPGTHEPVGPDDLAPLFPMDLIMQEVSQDSYIEIPGDVLEVYRQWRPTPLYRAHRLEKALGTPARIYYKYEGVSPAGSDSGERLSRWPAPGTAWTARFGRSARRSTRSPTAE